MQEYLDFFMTHYLLSAAWVVLLGLLIASFIKTKMQKFKVVPHQEATMLINRQDAKVLDVRSNEEFRKGHIVDAISLPLSAVKANNLGQQVEKLKSTPIIVVCNAGISSAEAAQALVKNEFEQVYSLKGGMDEWKAANLPIVRKKKKR